MSQSFTLKKINDSIVRPIPISHLAPENIKGYDLFPEMYGNIFLCARKKSGKTCAIFKIIKECSNKDTKVIIFSSTVNKDHNMKAICEWLDKKAMVYETYTSIDQHLKSILDELENKIDVDQKKEDEEIEASSLLKPQIVSFTETDTEIKLKIKKRKPKKMAPEVIFVFDDISTDLKSPDISKLVKQNRHYKSKVIISSQYPLDLQPQSRRQIDTWLLFAAIDHVKLETIFKDADLNVDFNLFEQMYHEATKEKYHFFYIDVRDSSFRKDFNLEFKNL